LKIEEAPPQKQEKIADAAGLFCVYRRAGLCACGLFREKELLLSAKVLADSSNSQ
jgi:hypothetical protein